MSRSGATRMRPHAVGHDIGGSIIFGFEHRHLVIVAVMMPGLHMVVQFLSLALRIQTTLVVASVPGVVLVDGVYVARHRKSPCCTGDALPLAVDQKWVGIAGVPPTRRAPSISGKPAFGRRRGLNLSQNRINILSWSICKGEAERYQCSNAKTLTENGRIRA